MSNKPALKPLDEPHWATQSEPTTPEEVAKTQKLFDYLMSGRATAEEKK